MTTLNVTFWLCFVIYPFIVVLQSGLLIWFIWTFRRSLFHSDQRLNGVHELGNPCSPLHGSTASGSLSPFAMTALDNKGKVYLTSDGSPVWSTPLSSLFKM